MSNRQARLIGLAIVALAGAIVTTGREAETGLVIVGISLLAFLVQFVFTFRAERVEDDFIDACDTCGYNLTGNTSGVCPECGTPVSDDLDDDEMDDDLDDDVEDEPDRAIDDEAARDSDDQLDDEPEDDDTPPNKRGGTRPNRE